MFGWAGEQTQNLIAFLFIFFLTLPLSYAGSPSYNRNFSRAAYAIIQQNFPFYIVIFKTMILRLS